MDPAGNVFITGYFSGTATFSSTNLVSLGFIDMFVAKYDGSGTFQWVRQAGGSVFDDGNAITTDTNGNCYVAGGFWDTAFFGGVSLISAGRGDAFIAKYDAAGNLQWVRSAGGADPSWDDFGFAVAVDGLGNVFLSGTFAGTATFGITTLVAVSYQDGFTAKYNSDGVFQWVRQVSYTRHNYQSTALAVDDVGSVYMSGTFYGTASFGSTNLTAINTQRESDGFVAKYDTTGTLQWVLQIGGDFLQSCGAIAVVKADKVYVTGSMTGVTSFGGITLTSDTTGEAGFFARIGALDPPVITVQPTGQIVDLGEPAALSITATNNPPIRYQWQRNGTNIVGGTNSTFGFKSVGSGDIGVPFRCVVSNFDGSTNSNTVQLTLNPNTRPVPAITSPADGSFYAAGDTLNYAGTGTDAEDGTLPAGAFSWTVEFHHDTHTHPFLGPIAGVTGGSFTIPALGEASTNVFYRIILTVTDSGGRQNTKSVDVLPRTTILTFTTSPPGLQVKLDGQTMNTPTNVPSVVGFVHSLGAASPQLLDGTNLNFYSWSDGGSTNHDITTPASDTTYTAVFTRNNAPVLQPISAKTVNEGSLLTFPISAADIDVQPANTLTFSLVSPPAGASIHPVTGVFSWTPNEAQGGSLHTLTVKVTDDGSPNLSDTKAFTVTVNKVNSPPVLTVPETQTIDEQILWTITLTAIDPDLPANTLTFSLVSAPSGVSLNSTTGVLTWTPSEAQGPSTNTLMVRVRDNGTPSLSDTKTFKVIVNEVNKAPVLAVIADQTVAENNLLSFRAVATDSDLPTNTLTYSLDSGAPTGASLHPNNGQFNWTPTEAQGPGVYPITVRVTDNGVPSLSASRTFNVTVNEVNAAPVLAPIANVTVPQWSQIMFTNSATDADLPANLLTFSLGAGTPGGASIHPTTGVFNWAIDDTAPASTNVIQVIVTDDGVPNLSATQSFTVTITTVPTNIVDLVNGVAVNGSERPCHNYYRFTVAPGQTRVLFEVSGLSGQGNLVLRRGALPNSTTFDYDYLSSPRISGVATVQQIIVAPTAGQPDISGEWYATVIGTDRKDLTFSIGAAAESVGPDGVLLVSPNGIKLSLDPIKVDGANAQFVSSTVPGEKYVVEVSADLKNWTLLISVVADSAVITITDPTPYTSTAPRFYRVRQIPRP